MVVHRRHWVTGVKGQLYLCASNRKLAVRDPLPSSLLALNVRSQHIRSWEKSSKNRNILFTLFFTPSPKAKFIIYLISILSD